MRFLLLALVAGLTLAAQDVPGWWRNMCAMKNLDATFVQESESTIFGKLKKTGRIQVSRPGKLRVVYDGGLLLVADGERLLQYDAQMRTASHMDLQAAARETPLLNLLLDHRLLEKSYRLETRKDGTLRLESRQPGNPSVDLVGEGKELKRIIWQDATGAKQVLELRGMRNPGSIPASQFKLKLPSGTRWTGRP